MYKTSVAPPGLDDKSFGLFIATPENTNSLVPQKPKLSEREKEELDATRGMPARRVANRRWMGNVYAEEEDKWEPPTISSHFAIRFDEPLSQLVVGQHQFPLGGFGTHETTITRVIELLKQMVTQG